jgi:hypothetical protein
MKSNLFQCPKISINSPTFPNSSVLIPFIVEINFHSLLNFPKVSRTFYAIWYLTKFKVGIEQSLLIGED